MNHPTLPDEVLDIIISYIVARAPPTWTADSPPQSPRQEESDAKRDVLTSALVCKAWLPVARRRLLSVYFPEGKMRILPDPDQLSRLIDILSSPLCTFQQGFLKILHVAPDPGLDDYYYENGSLLLELSALDNTAMPGLHTLIFDSFSPQTDVDEDEDFNGSEDNFEGDEDRSEGSEKGGDKSDNGQYRPPSTTSLFSQIKHLEFYHPLGPWFKDMIVIIRLCTSLEKVTARGARYEPAPHEIYPSLYPPKTLRKLDLDMESFTEMLEWLMSCKPPHAQISSVTISDFSWENDFDHANVQWFFNGVGRNLEELEIDAPRSIEQSGGQIVPFRIPKKDTIVNSFLMNSSLKRLRIAADLGVICEVLPYLFRNSEFAPSLEVLELTVFEDFLKEQLPILSKVVQLNGRIRSRPSLCRITVTPEGTSILPRDWQDLEDRMRRLLPRDEGHNIVQFEDIIEYIAEEDSDMS